MRIHRIRSGMTNCWLIQWSGRTLLVDAGIAWDRRFLGHLQRTVDPHMIELLFLTHGHTDHIGHAAALQEYYGIPAALHPADLALVKPPAPDIRAVRSGRKKEKHVPFSPAFLVPDGLPPSATPIPCPGHTAGSCALLVEDCLFAGDAVMSFLHPALLGYSENPQAARDSLLRLARLDCSMIYPAHGRPFPMERLRYLADKIQRS